MADVAVVGAGPAGVFTTSALLQREDVRIDVFDRRPTPFGLVRYGVAPDHLKIKSVVRTLHKTLADERVRFWGNVEMGRHLTIEQLRQEYSAVVLATGAPLPRSLDVPGEYLSGHFTSAAVVGWYNGDPEAATPLTGARSVAVLGAGNVALDIARVLLRSGHGLSHTDVTDEVIATLNQQPAQEVHLIARRGPADTKFTRAELVGLAELDDVEINVDPSVLALSDAERRRCEDDRAAAARVELLQQWATTPHTRGRARLVFHFRRPIKALLGNGHVEAVLFQNGDRLDVNGVVSAVGFCGVPIPDVPFDPSAGVIPNSGGKVAPGLYCTGWARRGPNGVIGVNKACATEVAGRVLEELPEADGFTAQPPAVAQLLRSAGVAPVSWAGWCAIDEAEIALGAERNRCRTKIADLDRLLALGTTVPTMQLPKRASNQ